MGAPSRPAETDRALVARAAAGDADAVARLYRRHVGRIHAFAYRRLGSADAAEEVTAATFERVVAALPAFRWRGGGFEPWLFRIAANEVATWARRRQRWDRGVVTAMRVRPVAPDDPADVVAGDSAVDDAARVRRALDRLSSRHQQALSLRFLADLDNASAADAAGCTRGAMAVTVHRALTALRRALDELEAEEAAR